jgi:predicted nucleic acid-binding protein
MNLLLDTNVLSEIRRPARAHPNVRRWFSESVGDEHFISALTIYELEWGAQNALRKGLPHAPLLRAWLDEQVLPGFAQRILPVDAPVARRCANLEVGRTLPLADALIAATALVHDLIIVTRNVQHFSPMGVSLFNPWTA